MSDHFVCSICGKEHAGDPTDYAYALPDEVWAIPEADRTTKAQFTSDLCQLCERYFIRGVMRVPFSERDGYFGWGVWAEVERPIFERYLRLYDEDGTSETPVPGVLANAVSVYKNTLGTPVSIQFEDPKSRPSIYLKSDDSSRLAVEQRGGMNNARYHEVLDQISPRR